MLMFELLATLLVIFLARLILHDYYLDVSFKEGHRKLLGAGVPIREGLLEVSKQSPSILQAGMVQGTLLLNPCVTIFSPKLLKKVYDRPDDFPMRVNLPAIVFGEAFLDANGEEWQHHRGAVKHCFKQERFNELFESKFHEMVSNWGQVGDGLVNASQDISSVTFATMAGFTFGKDFSIDPKDPVTSNFSKIYLAALQYAQTSGLLINIFKMKPQYLAKYFKYHQEQLANRTKLDAYLTSLIEERKAELEAGKYAEASDVLSLLLRERPKNYTDKEILASLVTFFFAGHDTTSSAISHTLWHLSKEPVLQQAIRNEISRGKDLSDCPVLHATILESLRLTSPTATGLIGCVDKDEGAWLAGHHIPKGTWIHTAYHPANLSKESWGEDSLKFNPKRFLKIGPRIDKVQASKIMAFGGGKRLCLGKDLAIKQVAVALHKIIGKFSFKLPKDTIHLPYIQCRTIGGILTPNELVLELTNLN